MGYIKSTRKYRDLDHNVRLSDIADYGVVYTAPSTTKLAAWEIGDRVTIGGWESRSFVYAKAAATIQPEFLAVNPWRDTTNAVAPTAVAVGSNIVYATIGATDGSTGAGIVAENEYAGGMIVVNNGANQHPESRGIIGNSAVSGGGTSTIYIDAPLLGAVTTSSNLEIMPNPFFNIMMPSSAAAHSPYESAVGYCSAVGVPIYTATVGQYVWIQTYGPVWITNPGNTGETLNDRMLWYVGGTTGDGSIRSGAQVTLTNGAAQYIGYAMDGSASNASNAPWVFLELSR